jgi:PKHD-type hydroxylase
LNSKYYGFDLTGFEDALQYTVYNESDTKEHYTWHVDNLGQGRPGCRKLSIVIQLSDPQEYEGGELQLHYQSYHIARKDKGLLYIFPSYVLHRVTPVTGGTRRSLVGWICGPDFR